MKSSKANNNRPFVVGLGIKDHNTVHRRDQGSFDEAMKVYNRRWLSDNPNSVCKHRNKFEVREEVKWVMMARSV